MVLPADRAESGQQEYTSDCCFVLPQSTIIVLFADSLSVLGSELSFWFGDVSKAGGKLSLLYFCHDWRRFCEVWSRPNCWANRLLEIFPTFFVGCDQTLNSLTNSRLCFLQPKTWLHAKISAPMKMLMSARMAEMPGRTCAGLRLVCVDFRCYTVV